MLVHPRFDPLAVLQAIQDYKINCMMLVPTMIYALLDHPRFGEFDLSSLETVFYGASLMSPVRLKEAIERIGPVFFQFYGQAEAPMTITVLRKAEHDVTNKPGGWTTAIVTLGSWRKVIAGANRGTGRGTAPLQMWV
jgi:fatty-acyl-CoA synthase